MVVQLLLPAQWARLESHRNPRERLAQLHHDALDAKAEIRATLDRLAARHRISAKDIAYAIDGYADNLLDDAIYKVKKELEHEELVNAAAPATPTRPTATRPTRPRPPR